MKKQEFKITEEMKENEKFLFNLYVYENTEDCIYVNDDSLEFYNEYGNLTNLEEATEFSMSYYTKEDITNDDIDKKTKEILLNVLKEKGWNEDLRILKSQGSYGYLLPVELGVEVVNDKELFFVGEDLEGGNLFFESFNNLEEAEEAFEKRLQERRR
jgi:hypothetical protein